VGELARPTWEEFVRLFRKRWTQGEHVFINGQTGSGKTDLLLRLLDMRSHSVVFVTKPRDPIFYSPLAKPYRKINEFEPRSYDKRLMLSAKRGATTRDDVTSQSGIFKRAFDRIYKQGGWTVGVDESLWISNRLRLANDAGDGAFMGRALGLTYVFATQRPAHIPVIIPQSASHAFIGKTGRRDDLLRLAELGGDVPATRAAIASLRDKHDFLYLDTQSELPMMIVNTQA